MRYAIRLHFPASNNAAEYEALVNGLHIAIELWIKWFDARGDSRLVIDQVMKEPGCHDPKMNAYCKAVRRLEEKFDGLAKMASERATVPQDVFVSDIYKPSVDYKNDGGSDEPQNKQSTDPKDADERERETMDIEPEPPATDDSPDWRYPLLQRLVDGTLPLDHAEARRVARRAKTFVLLDGAITPRLGRW